jgi:hypothetical protein
VQRQWRNFFINDGNRYISEKQRGLHSSRIVEVAGDLYKQNFADCYWNLGGNLAMQFTLSGNYNRYGAWGLTDDVGKPDHNSLFQTVRELIGSGMTKR